MEYAQMKLFLWWYQNLRTFTGTGKKGTENTKYYLNAVLAYQIIFWLTSGIPMHIKCFKSATDINTIQKQVAQRATIAEFNVPRSNLISKNI